MADLFDEFGIGSEQANAPDLFDEFGLGESLKPAAEGITDTLWQGTKSAGRAIGATVDAYTGDSQGIVDKAAAQQAAPKDSRVEKFHQDFAQRTEALGEDPGVLDTIGEGIGAVWDNPAGAGLAVVEQLPNAVPTLAGGWAGMKGGAAAGAVAGAPFAGVGAGPGAVIGGVVGGLAGMFLGNAAIETGHKAMGMADDGEVTDEERGQAIEEGAVKGAVITGVDALTLGLGGKVASTLNRTATTAVETATRKALLDRGVDVADEAAVLAAKSNPETFAAVRAAQENAIKATDTLKRRAAQGGTLFAMETVGEGVGEYLGEMAATGEGSVPDAVLESLLSAGQSGVETAWNMSRKSPNSAKWVQPTPSAENPNPAPVQRPDPSAGPLSAAANLLPAPSIAGALPAPDQTLYGDGLGNVSPVGPARDVDREYRPVPGREQPVRDFGPGMDQQYQQGAAPGIEGQLIRASRQQQAPAGREPQTFDAVESPRLLAPAARIVDGRQDAVIVDAAGNAVPGKLSGQQPEDYVQGGRGMDQQAPTRTYSNVLAAKNAISKYPNPAQLEVVPVGPKQFEIRSKRAAPTKGARKTVDREKDSVVQAIARLGGIKTEWRQDTTGEAKGNRIVPGVGALWTDKTGTSIDDMASLLQQNGYVPAGEMEKDGGVSWLQAAISDELTGRKTHLAPGSKRQEEEAQQLIAQREADIAAQQEAAGDFDSAEVIVSDLLDDLDIMEIRAERARKFAEELDAIFEGGTNENSTGTASADNRPAEDTRTENGAGGSAGTGESGQVQQPDARAESPAEVEAPSLELSSYTEQDLAAQAKLQAEAEAKNAAETKAVADKAQADRDLNDFTLSGSDRPADVAASRGQNDMFGTATQRELETAAHEAATSPRNDLPEPTEAQKEAGNYRKGHVTVQGLDLTIENPRGSERTGKREDGSEWRHTMSDHYGYIKRTTGADGEHVDIYLGESPESDRVFVVDQLDQQTGGFDEHKVMLGFTNKIQAVAAYRSNFDAGWKVGPVSTLTMDQFKEWLKGGDLAKPAAQAQQQAEQREKIQDFGEKIGGARKDRAVSTGARPARASDGDTRPAWARRFEISQVVSSTNTAEIGRWEVRDTRSKDWMKKPKKVGTGSYATREEAEQAVPLIAVAQKHRAVPLRQGDGTGFEIWRDITDRKRVKVVDQVFPSREAALKYMAANAQQIIETNTTFGEADLPRPDNALRIGAARREGPVKDRDFFDTFGFRGVEFGNWNNQEERQQLLDDAYDGLLDLAEVMNIPPKAISLNGELALAFGARGHGLSGARAHYEPAKAAINLTKMNGAGSLAHEWFHALDHYFGRQDGKASAEWVVDEDGTRSLKTSGSFEREAVSSGFRRSGSGVRLEVRQAYAELMKTMTVKAEQYVEDTARADAFVARSRKEVADRLDRLRAELAEQKDPKYWKRSNKPASAEQLAAFDTVAQQILDGVQLETELRSTTPDAPVRRRNAFSGMRWTNDALEQISAIYKAVRGRSGFNADNNGELDRLRSVMSGYSSRLKMLADAQVGGEKTKQVPTQFAMDAKELDQGRGTDYWTTPHEMAARAFQGYVEDMIADRGGSSPFLNYGPESAAIPTPWGWKRPFPAGEERKAINEAFTKLVQTIESRETENGNVALYRLSADTQAAYEQRIDDLFAGAEPNNTAGVRVLDRSDVLDLLGYGDREVVLAEKHAVSDGRFNHPQFTAADWKKVPEWLENPVAVFARDDGHLTVIAPETKGGEPIIIGINPDARQAGYAGGKRLHVVLSAYNKDRGRLPIERMVRDGQLRYVDTRKSPAFNDSSGHRLPSNVAELRGLGKKVYTGADLFKYRSASSATDGPQLRLNPGKAKGIPAFSAKAIARQVQEASGLRAVVVDNEFALPTDVLEQVLRDGVVGRVAGLYYRGTAYLVASNLQNVKHAQEVLLHEVVGHQGVRAVLGARTEQVMQQIYGSMPAAERQELEARYAGQLLNMDELERQITVAEEYVAHLAETNPQHSVIQRLVALVRAFLRRVFGAKGALHWTHEDIVALLADSRRLISRGEPSAETSLQPAGAVSYRQTPAGPVAAGLPQVEEVDEAEFVASLKDEGAVRSIARSLYRARGTDSPFFQRWFEGSRMVDKAGRPIAFVHRSFGEKVRFDDSRLGGSTGTATASLGHFLARQDVGNVERYGPVVDKFYVRMRKPKVITQQQFEAMGDWSQTKVEAYRKTLMEQGHDGLYIQGLAWPVVFEGKNIKATRNAGTFDETDQVRYSLAQDAADLFSRFGQRPADVNDPFAEENRRLREQDKTLWSRAKQQFRRQFAPGGLLPQAVFGEKVRRDSEFQAVEFDVRHMAGGLEQAVKADFGVVFDQLPEAQMKQLAEALAGRVDPALPQRTREAVVAMRQYIDSLSGEYIGILQQQIEQNLEGADPALVETISRNIGSYVNRSYRAFDDEKWFEKVPTETLNAARRYLANQYRGQGASEQEAGRLADLKVNELLKTGTAYSSMESMIAEGKLGAKDLSLLIKRKEIAPEIRALLGEYIDPRVNFAKSATKMGRLIWNQRFLDRVRAQGMGTFLFEEQDRPAGATEQLAGEQSDTYAPLNGLWTFPEVAQSFRDAMGKEQMSDLYRTIVRLNGMVKYGKTVLSPTTAMRNWQSAMFFSLANGHFDLTQMKKSLAAFREQVSQKATGDDLVYLRKLKQLGVVYDTPYAGEMARLIEDARLEELLDGKTGTGLKWLNKINQFAQGFYSFGDDFWKIIGFENEKAGLLQAGFSVSEAERMAAERIRNTYPTYSMVGRGIDWLRRFPLAGTFVSFPSEVIRTSVNMLRLTASDLKSDNPALQALGRKRAAGMAMVSAGFYALAAMTAAAFGVDDDEEEALRDLAPDWQKNSTFLYAGRDADGKLRYFDMSFLDPYGYLKRPLTAMLRDQPWEKAAASGIADLLSPFLGADIAAGALFEVMANKKGSGGQVYQENGDPVDQTLDIADHLRKALQPGFMSNAERLVLAGQGVRKEGSGQAYDMRDEVVSLLGWRASTTDPRTALHYRAYDFGDALADSRRVLTRELRSQNKVDEGDIRSAKETAEQQYQQAFREMGRLVQAAQTAGMSRPQVMQTLRMSGVSSADVAQLLSGEAPQFRLSPSSMGRAVQQARLVGGAEHAAEVAKRFRLAMQL